MIACIAVGCGGFLGARLTQSADNGHRAYGGQRRAEQHKPDPRRQRERAGHAQHRKNQAAHGGGVALCVGAGDLGHQQAGQRPQHRKREKQQRERHTL